MNRLPRRVLAIGAHPDDIELACAGTLARFLTAGASVQLAVVCRGDRGGRDGPDPTLASRRRTEAITAAEILGAPIEFLEVGDAEVRDTPELRDQFLKLFRVVRPDLIVTHGPTDYHPDHVNVSKIVANSAWFAASGGHRTEQPPLENPPSIVYMDNVAGMGFEPTHLVDISKSFDLKRRMLACHNSQVNRADGGIHHLEELAEVQARFRGFQCGVRYAEGFRFSALWGRQRPEPIFP